MMGMTFRKQNFIQFHSLLLMYFETVGLFFLIGTTTLVVWVKNLTKMSHILLK